MPSPPLLTPGEQAFFLDAMLCSVGGLTNVKIDYARPAEVRALKDGRSACATYCNIRKKIMSAGDSAGEGGAKSASVTPRKAVAGTRTPKETPKGKGKRMVEDVVGGEGDGEDMSKKRVVRDEGVGEVKGEVKGGDGDDEKVVLESPVKEEADGEARVSVMLSLD